MTETARRSLFPPVSPEEARADVLPQAQPQGFQQTEALHIESDWAEAKPMAVRADMADTQPILPLTSTALAEQCQRVSAKVIQLSGLVEKGWDRSEEIAMARYDSEVARLDAGRDTAHAQIAEINSALDGFAELCASRRGILDSELQYQEHHSTVYSDEIQAKERGFAMLEEEAAELSASASKTQADITVTRAKIERCKEKLGELTDESIAIDEAAAKRRQETEANRLAARERAGRTAQEAQSPEELTEILQDLLLAGAGPETSENDTRIHQREDAERVIEIRGQIINLVIARDGYDGELNELVTKRSSLIESIEQNVSETAEVSLLLQKLRSNLDTTLALATELRKQSVTLELIEGLDLDAIEPERVTDALSAPYNAAIKLRNALEKGVVLTIADELSSEGVSEGSAVDYGNGWFQGNTSSASFIQEVATQDSQKQAAEVVELETRPNSPFADAVRKAKHEDEDVDVIEINSRGAV